jgi:hypothetical protein
MKAQTIIIYGGKGMVFLIRQVKLFEHPHLTRQVNYFKPSILSSPLLRVINLGMGFSNESLFKHV